MPSVRGDNEDEDEDVNQRVHDMMRSDWLKFTTSALTLVLTVLMALVAWQGNRIIEKQDSFAQTLSTQMLATSTDHERVNTIQSAQQLLSKLVDQLRQDVARHDYQIQTMQDAMRDSAARQRPAK